MTEPLSIESDGDELEMEAWRLWARERFPSYETFWLLRVVPLTYREGDRRDLRFRTTAELDEQGFTDEDVTVAQLHYTLLRHLHRVFVLLDDAHASIHSAREQRGNRAFAPDHFYESFTRLSGVSDLADELLGRRARPGAYRAWNEKDAGKARRAWRAKSVGDPLKPVRRYRNRLVHGRVVPETYVPVNDADGRTLGLRLFYPRLAVVDRYLDWRIAFEAAAGPIAPEDFDEAALIVGDAWELVVEHVETSWRSQLLHAL